MNIPYQITPQTITAIVTSPTGLETLVAASDHVNFAKIKAMLISDSTDTNALANLFDVARQVSSYGKGKVAVVHGVVYHNGRPLHNYTTSRLLQFMKDGLPIEPLINFITRLMKNPSRNSVDQLYKFLEHRNMPITPDGCFIAYRGVQDDFYSKTGNLDTVVLQGVVNAQGQILNSVGSVIEVERNSVCDDAKVSCGEGIHVGSLRYASDWAGCDGKLVLVKCAPEDAVSVPHDSSCEKLRLCKYEVLSEHASRAPLGDGVNSDYNTQAAAEPTVDYAGGDDNESDEYLDGFDAGWADYDNGNANLSKYLADNDYKVGYIAGWDELGAAFDEVD